MTGEDTVKVNFFRRYFGPPDIRKLSCRNVTRGDTAPAARIFRVKAGGPKAAVYEESVPPLWSIHPDAKTLHYVSRLTAEALDPDGRDWQVRVDYSPYRTHWTAAAFDCDDALVPVRL
jgi:hypothetical protein